MSSRHGRVSKPQRILFLSKIRTHFPTLYEFTDISKRPRIFKNHCNLAINLKPCLVPVWCCYGAHSQRCLKIKWGRNHTLVLVTGNWSFEPFVAIDVSFSAGFVGTRWLAGDWLCRTKDRQSFTVSFRAFSCDSWGKEEIISSLRCAITNRITCFIYLYQSKNLQTAAVCCFFFKFYLVLDFFFLNLVQELRQIYVVFIWISYCALGTKRSLPSSLSSRCFICIDYCSYICYH